MADNSTMPVMDDDEKRAADYAEQLRRRLLMARVHWFGVDETARSIKALRARLLELGYDKKWSEGTLQAMQSGRDARGKPRVIAQYEIPVLAQACGVPGAFFRVDLDDIEDPSLRLEVSRLRADLDEMRADLAALSRTSVQLSAELRELRNPGQSEESPEDEQ